MRCSTTRLKALGEGGDQAHADAINHIEGVWLSDVTDSSEYTVHVACSLGPAHKDRSSGCQGMKFVVRWVAHRHPSRGVTGNGLGGGVHHMVHPLQSGNCDGTCFTCLHSGTCPSPPDSGSLRWHAAECSGMRWHAAALLVVGLQPFPKKPPAT